MRTSLSIVAVIAVVLLAGYFVVRPSAVTTNPQTATYSSPELGIEFSYPSGPDGYVVEERTSTEDAAGLVRTITLFRTEDKANEDAIPVGGEGPPVIAVLVFANPQNQWSRTWADTHVQYSSINLKMGDIVDTTIGGANAIRYKADGLYASENAVVAHGDNVYVLTGQYMNEDSDIRRDFAPLVDSIKFIPTPGQE